MTVVPPNEILQKTQRQNPIDVLDQSPAGVERNLTVLRRRIEEMEKNNTDRQMAA